MSAQPEALRLAEKLERQVHKGSYDRERVEPMMRKAAAELRRLYAENDALRAALPWPPTWMKGN